MAQKVDMEWEGLDSLITTVKQVSPRATNFLFSEMLSTVYEAFNQSQIQVPRRYGILAASGNVQVLSESPIEITISYGGPAAGYAYWVHENLTARHKAPTKAKYLEDPVTVAMAKMEPRVQSRVEGAIMGQTSQQASIAQGAAIGGATVAHTGGKSARGHAHKATIARAQGMSRDEIRAALDVIDHGTRVRGMLRAGDRALRTYRKPS